MTVFKVEIEDGDGDWLDSVQVHAPNREKAIAHPIVDARVVELRTERDDANVMAVAVRRIR